MYVILLKVKNKQTTIKLNNPYIYVCICNPYWNLIWISLTIALIQNEWNWHSIQFMCKLIFIQCKSVIRFKAACAARHTPKAALTARHTPPGHEPRATYAAQLTPKGMGPGRHTPPDEEMLLTTHVVSDTYRFILARFFTSWHTPRQDTCACVLVSVNDMWM